LENYKDRLLDARQDRLDLRDREYRPLLKSLSEAYPEPKTMKLIIECYDAVEMILDQGSDGACTGYALASIINYLLWEKVVGENYKKCLKDPSKFKIEKVSERMLFNLARIYDEWDGEDYEGSSCRSAIKGWHKHGVCQNSCWEFSKDQPDSGWEKEAVERPLGAYYRVEKESISDMQSALCEVGALYVSATIHEGWERPLLMDTHNDIPTIPYEIFPKGIHAFVIVGYTRYGFIIQNSWGIGWGNRGFALLTYRDWLKNGMDVWVAVMGVPIDMDRTPYTYSNLALSEINNELVEGTETIKKALNYDYTHKNLEPISEEKAYEHTLVLNSHGRAKHTIVYTCSLERSIDIICYDNIKAWLDDSTQHRKVALYALGGFKDEKEYMSKIRIMAPYFLENGIYPIFLTWQNSYFKAVEYSIESFFQDIVRSGGRDVEEADVLKDRVALNRAIENHSRKISTRAIWAEIKEKALKANLEEIEEFESIKRGALHILTDSFQQLQQEYGYDFELHAIAHSVGAELIARNWLVELADRGMVLSSLQLIAPTISLKDANEYIIYAQEQALFQKDDIHVYMMDREREYADTVSRYDKSLLCLISRSLEKIHKTPLLGLADAWSIEDRDKIFNTQHLNDIKRWYEFSSKGEKRATQHYLKKEDSHLKSSLNNDFIELKHENLDSSISILETLLKIIFNNNINSELKFNVENLC